MSRGLKITDAAFFTDPKTIYAAKHDQQKWAEQCIRLVNSEKSFIYKNPKLFEAESGEVFDAIIGKLIEGRKNIAKIIGEKETYNLGIVRSSDSSESEKKSNRKFQDGYPMMSETDQSEALDLVMKIAQENYKKTSMTHPELIVSANVNENRCKVIYKFYGGESYIAVDRVSIPMFPEIYGDATMFYPVGNYQQDVRERVGDLLKQAYHARDDNEIQDIAAKLRWNMIASSYFCQGSASVATMLEALVYSYHDFTLVPRKPSMIRNDVKCLLYPSEELYVASYAEEFEGDQAPKPEAGKQNLLSLLFDTAKDLRDGLRPA